MEFFLILVIVGTLCYCLGLNMAKRTIILHVNLENIIEEDGDDSDSWKKGSPGDGQK